MDTLDAENPDERWLPIESFPGYEVSDLGHVRSLARMSGGKRNVKVPARTMTCTIINGYPRVTLTINGKPFYREVHRLVAITFIGPCPPGQEVRHIFGDSTKAALSGLAYGTRAQNIADCKKHGGFRNGAAHLTEDHVREIAASAEVGSVLAERYSISAGVISQIRTGRAWKHLTLTINPNRRRRAPNSSPETIIAIAQAAGKLADIAKQFGVSISLVSHIKCAKRVLQAVGGIAPDEPVARPQEPSLHVSPIGEDVVIPSATERTPLGLNTHKLAARVAMPLSDRPQFDLFGLPVE